MAIFENDALVRVMDEYTEDKKNYALMLLPKKLLEILDIHAVIIAGNCLNGNPHDVDLFQVNTNDFDIHKFKSKLYKDNKPLYDEWCIVSNSKNAITIVDQNKKMAYQFCKLCRPLKDLVNGFDYAHVQIGVQFRCIKGEFDSTDYVPVDVQFTLKHIKYKLTGDTEYTGSEWPLSSLLRCSKYVMYGNFKGRGYYASLLNCLTDILSRGYEDYEDYKEQLASIDLSLLEEDEQNAAYKFYTTCCECGLVKNPEIKREE